MTAQEKVWFDEIAHHRQRAWDDVFSDSAFIGVMHGVVEKYAGLGHFVYELLQNADDARAKNAEFDLLEDRLVFKHNGEERFTVTSRASERDGQSIRGHLNALTSIGASEKIRQKNLGNVIGKFGVGFKAVFQYTNRPEIYDDNMAFALEHYIVPKLIKSDFPGRKAGETVFVFPFDRKDKPNAREEIWEALQKLVYPTLFLNYLKHVTYRYGNLRGEYRVDCLFEEKQKDENVTFARLLDVVSKKPDGEDKTRLWMFSSTKEDNRFCVGYGVNDKGEIIPIDKHAFCFFPTRHDTKLKFIIHAPFLLNDSREGILSGSEHNDKMVGFLAELATTALFYLCRRSQAVGHQIVTDDIVKVIPITKIDYGDGISFDQFRALFCLFFRIAKVIPAKDCYVDKKHAYWAESIAAPVLFSDEQLQELYCVEDIHWAFKQIPKENQYRNVGKELTSDVFSFIEECTSECVYDNNIIGRITAAFVERQPMEWMEKLYDWIADNKERVNKARTAPIFFDQCGRACAAYGANGQTLLYLPLEGEERYRMVRADLLGNEHAKRLIDKYNLKEPDRRDWVLLILSQKLAKCSPAEADGLLAQVLGYYVGCGNADRFVIEHQLAGIRCWRSAGGGDALYTAAELYFESPRTHAYFDRIGGRSYLDIDRYRGMVDGKYAEDVKSMFDKIGIAEFARMRRVEMPNDRAASFWHAHRDVFEWSTRTMTFVETEIDGLAEYLTSLNACEDIVCRKSMSLVLWEMLDDMAKSHAAEYGTFDVAGEFKGFMTGEYRYFNRRPKSQKFTSRHQEKLLSTAWLVTAEGRTVPPKDATGDQLDEDYRKLPDFSVVCDMLDIPATTNRASETVDEQKARDSLSDVAKTDLALGETASKLGLTVEDMQEMARLKASRATPAAPASPSDSGGDGMGTAKGTQPSSRSDEAPGSIDGTDEIGNDGNSPSDALEAARSAVRKASEKTKAYRVKRAKTGQVAVPEKRPAQVSEDSDPLQPKAVDFEERAEELRKKVEAQIDLMKEEADLQSAAVDAEEYTYAWLKARLQLEMRANGADDDKDREACVSFAKMEREPDGENMFMLSATPDAIPQWFEEEVNQRLTIRIPGRQDIETVIESMSVLSFRLRAKVRILPGMENIDWSQVVEARTVATKPTFLLQELMKGYEELHLEDDFNMKQNLPEDMRFVFGPPGTGKTTHLARKVLIPLARDTAHPHVLVLTPTNKAADVLTKRIVQECGEDKSYEQWLTRFGITLDAELQGSPVARAKDVEIDDEHPAVVVSTVIRFAYDAFTSMNKCKLSDFKWDHVIIDEASMIPLMQILYPIYRAKGAKFVIAGDPMQIAPVVMSDLSVGQNIYTMVNLNDFAHPTTEPQQFEVVCLDEQFRSVPCIGRIFSEFAYGGKLRHHRSAADEKDLDLGVTGMDPIKPLTVLRYPVSRFESIFKIKLLGMSSYQIYSALFVFEYICKLAEGLKAGGRKGFRIGVISPYRAQADIVDRLIAKLDRQALDGVEVHVGTVHSFQGDECEMIIALLNPPQGMGRKEGSFINDKKVLNVAISRARDYLVLAIPDAKTPNVQYLRGPLTIERLMRQTPGVFAELQTPDLEASVWGDRDYVEKNTYSTGHQKVNVYETPEKRFEVRSEDAALDVHFRADRSDVAPDDDFISERSRIEVEVSADERARQTFAVPEGFHCPVEGERVPVMKQYYVIGQPEPLECESEVEDIDPSRVLAIED